jgi:hypothetical protein
MSAKPAIAAAAITVLVAPALASAEARIHAGPDAFHRQWNAALMSGAYAAARKSRATRPARSGRVSPPTDPSGHRVTTPDGREAGADPDAAVRFQLRRDSMPRGGM